MRRTALLCLPAALALAACGTTVAGQASPAVTSAAPTTVGASEADREAVGELFEGLSESSREGLAAHAEYMADHEHPEFAYTADECLAAFRSAGLADDYTVDYVADTDSMVPDDGWTVGGDLGRYAGLQPSGEVYVLPVDVTQTFGGTTDSYSSDLHAALLDGDAYFFFACDGV